MTIEQNLPALLAAEGPPDKFIAALAQLFKDRVGWKMLTFTTYSLKQNTVRRVFTTDAVHYPVDAQKPLTESDWADLVITRGQIFVAAKREDYKAHYVDWEKLYALKLESAVNFPIVVAGETIGTVNLLEHEPDFYTPERVSAGRVLEPLAALAFLLITRAEAGTGA